VARVGSIDQSVLDAMVEHRLPQGKKLTEEQLGAIFGASRTTVRNALQALAHDHIGAPPGRSRGLATYLTMDGSPSLPRRHRTATKNSWAGFLHHKAAGVLFVQNRFRSQKPLR
jgi:hypothetical protein